MPGQNTPHRPSFLKNGIGQVAMLVQDLDRAVETYWQRLGVGPWRLYTYRRPFVKRMTYRGQPADYSMRVAMASLGPLVIELIQPLQGDSIYAEFVSRRGYGLHHVGFVVDDIPSAIAEAEAAGFRVAMDGGGYGLDGDGAFVYLDTEDTLGVTIELVELPKRRAQPERTYPPLEVS